MRRPKGDFRPSLARRNHLHVLRLIDRASVLLARKTSGFRRPRVGAVFFMALAAPIFLALAADGLTEAGWRAEMGGHRCAVHFAFMAPGL
jgi:hypothetical protein